MIALADTGSDVSGWFTVVVLVVAVLVWIVLSLRTIRREGLTIPVEPLAPPQVSATAPRCSTLGCPNPPTRNPHGWLLCDECPPNTTKENPVLKPVEIHVDPEGESATIRPKDLPAVANVAAYTAAVSFEQVEDLYVRMRSRRLGVGGGGDL